MNWTVAGNSEFYRYTQAHLTGSCRRKVILSYFGEPDMNATYDDECCDVCSGREKEALVGVQEELEIVLRVTKDMSGKGEKKVSTCQKSFNLQSYSACPDHSDFYYMYTTQIAERVAGSCSGLSVEERNTSTSFGSGCKLGHNVSAWRALIRVAWLLDLLERQMVLGGGERMAGNIVMNSFAVTDKGEDFLTLPHPVEIPQLLGTHKMLTLLNVLPSSYI